jgi:hypothetical protein
MEKIQKSKEKIQKIIAYHKEQKENGSMLEGNLAFYNQ